MVSFKTKSGKVVSFPTKKKVSGRSERKKKFRVRVQRKSRSRASPKTAKRQTMARQRRRRSGGSSSAGLVPVLLGGAVAGFIGSMVPFGPAGKIAVAAVAHRQGGIIGNTAKALGTIGAANIVQGVGLTGGATSISSSLTGGDSGW